MLEVARQPPVRHPHSLRHVSRQLPAEVLGYQPAPRSSKSTAPGIDHSIMASTSTKPKSGNRSAHQDRDRRGSVSVAPAQQYVEGSRFKHSGSGRRESTHDEPAPLTRSNLAAHETYQQDRLLEMPHHRHHGRSSSIAVPEQYSEIEASRHKRSHHHHHQLVDKVSLPQVVYTDVPRRIRTSGEHFSTPTASTSTSLSSRRNSEPVVLPVRPKRVEDPEEEVGVETWEPDPRDPARYVRRVYHSSVSSGSGQRASETSDEVPGRRRSGTGKRVRFAEADSLILL